ncbi:MAG: hypothetical protein KA716_31745 [Gloeotrichia echinulata DEX184]|jgi:hypothetical protein|nr:hypothetical protein [Gloeotrichia echinulata DEX184]
MTGFPLYLLAFILSVLVVLDGILSANGLINILQANNLYTYILAIGMGIFITGMSLIHKLIDNKPIALKILVYLGIALDVFTTFVATNSLIGNPGNSGFSNFISNIVGLLGGIALTGATIYAGEFLESYGDDF